MTNVSHLNVMIDTTLEDAFPDVEAGIEPLGSRVMVQLRTAKGKTKGGIILTSETKETELWNTQTAKVIAVGPLAYHDRKSGLEWPEKAWCKPGDFVRVPKYAGDKWQVPVPGREEEALFAMFNDADIIGRVTGDPLKIKAFV
jgi:co-chaperonin GroES (HSP10)